MDNHSYYVTKNKKTREAVFLEYEKMDGYQVNPKVREKDAIEVDKIVFVNPEFSEKIIRKKIDKKIEKLLQQLKLIEEDNEGGEDAIKKSLMDAEKLRLQIINNYVKYLGHTYESLTIKKIQIIIETLRYKLYMIKVKEREMLHNHIYHNMYEEKESKRGR